MGLLQKQPGCEPGLCRWAYCRAGLALGQAEWGRGGLRLLTVDTSPPLCVCPPISTRSIQSKSEQEAAGLQSELQLATGKMKSRPLIPHCSAAHVKCQAHVLLLCWISVQSAVQLSLQSLSNCPINVTEEMERSQQRLAALEQEKAALLSRLQGQQPGEAQAGAAQAAGGEGAGDGEAAQRGAQPGSSTRVAEDSLRQELYAQVRCTLWHGRCGLCCACIVAVQA